MAIEKPSPIQVWAGDADPADIAEPSGGQQLAGFTPTIAAPPMQWVNWILKQATGIASYMMAKGVPDYDADEVYSGGDTVRWTDGLIYEHKDIGNTTGIAPPRANTWDLFGATWLPDVLKDSLAAKLPALMLAGLLSVSKTEQYGTYAYGACRIAGLIQFAWKQMTLDMGGNYPVNTAMTWKKPFFALSAVMATPRTANCTFYIPTSDENGCTVGVQSTQTSPPNPATAFVFAIGFPTSDAWT